MLDAYADFFEALVYSVPTVFADHGRLFAVEVILEQRDHLKTTESDTKQGTSNK